MLNQYNLQKSRGTEGFGIFDGSAMHMVHEAKEKNILRWLRRNQSNLLMFHHRNPTSTINVSKACHPFSTKDYFGDTQYVLIHNGHIWNAEDLYLDHQLLGIEYQSLLEDMTFNDSESLLWDFALFMEGKQEKMEVEGGIAFICMKLVKGKLERLYFDRNTSPLMMERDKSGLRLSSEGVGEPTEPGMLYNYNYALNRLTKHELILDSYRPAPTNYAANSGFQSTHKYNDDQYWDDYDKFEEQKLLTAASKKAQDDERYPGNWLPDSVKSQLGLYKTQKVIEYEPNPITHVMEPVTKTVDTLNIKDNGYAEVLMDSYLPTVAEIEEACLRFLIPANGNFESAYWQLELALETLDGEPRTDTNIKQQVLFERAIEWINSDEEYKNAKSVSSIWRSLCVV